jgi:hypothetical protein
MTNCNTAELEVEKVSNFKSFCVILAWWYTSVIPALRRLKQEDHEFKTSLGYIGRPFAN